MRRLLLATVIAVSGAGLVIQGQEPGAEQERTYLRWPHERADLTPEARRQLRESIFIINNFGLYQGGDAPQTVYFHDGLDIVLRNNTPIYAIVNGYVRWINGTPPYMQVTVEDADTPGWGWMYVHIDRVPFREGEFVEEGRQLAVVNFQGLEHIHLNRVMLTPNGRWTNYSHLNFVQPVGLFEFIDEEPPTIETPFRYFLNESDDELRNGTPTRVSGEIDIVAGMRDGGRYAHGDIGTLRGYGDRLAPERATISIAAATSPNRPIWEHVAFDFSKLLLGTRRGIPRSEQVYTLFKFRPLVQTAPPGMYNHIFSYYVLTSRGNNDPEPRTIQPSDSLSSWNTLAVGPDGRPLFPDGEYIVTVTAWDAAGNKAVARGRVIVANR